MEKKGEKGLIKTWKKRWFELGKGVLLYYLSEPILGEENARTPKGTIDLKEVTRVQRCPRAEHKEGYPFSIVTSKRTYYLLAASQNEMVAWTKNLERAVADAQRV